MTSLSYVGRSRRSTLTRSSKLARTTRRVCQFPFHGTSRWLTGLEKTTYVYADKTEIVEVPPPPPPPAPAPSTHYAQSLRSISPSRHGHEVYEERIEESNHIGGPLTVLVPEEARREDRSRHDRHRSEERRITRVEHDTRSERDIKEEIRALEAERRMLKYEREGDYEIIERREPRREVVRVEKDRKGRLALVRSAR